MALPKPLLWVPKRYVERERGRLAQDQPESFLRVALGYEEVFGIKPSWDDLLARLRQYSLAQVLGCIGRISGVLQHFIANGLFHHGDTEVHTLPRAYDLYLSDKPQLHNHPSYVNLPAAAREATGLDPETFWFILFAFMSHWRTIEPKDIADGTWA